MTYEWSPGTLDWLEQRGIEPAEVMQALLYGPRWPRPARTAEGLMVRTVWGRTKAGRPLIVVLRPGTRPLDHWIVNATEMTANQVVEFEGWEATRDD